MKKLILPLIVFACCHAQAQQVTITKDVRNAMNRIDTNTIRSHIAYLADDKLKGRLPGTEGYQMAVDYVVDQFKKMGVAPGGEAGSYTQKLLIRKSIVDNSSAFACLKDKDGNVDSLLFSRDFIPTPHPLKENTSAEGKVAFAGYGIDAPNIYSDYEGIEVKGKIVVVMSGAPQGFSNTTTAILSNVGNKYKTAFSKGALGVIVVNPASSGRYNPNLVVQTNVATNTDKTAAYSGFRGDLNIVMTGTRNLLNRIFSNSGKKLSQVLNDIRNKKPSSFETNFTLHAGYKTSHTDIESYNVIGLIPGSDKELKNEYVVHTAHLDHVGVGRPVDGDSIYNGAHDNASGVASLLEIARIYKSPGVKPKRSILIVMVTAEEMGLLGSSYFASNPTVPQSSIVANVNTDMPTLIAPLLSVVPLGAEHSSLMNNVQFAASQLGLEVEEDPEPNENRFVRSDQFSFVLNGIPALHIKYGNKTSTGESLVPFVRQWRAKYYHRPADGIDGIFNFTAAKTYVQLNFLISYSVAQTTARPAWNQGGLFVAGRP